jgi:hypothetical protein
MRAGWRDPSSMSWRLAARVDPEMVALALVVLLALAALLAMPSGSPSGNTENRSPDPSSDPRSSRSVTPNGMPEVAVSLAWPSQTELDST